MLADIQSFHLLACADAEADGLLDDPEQAIAEHEHRHERRGDRNRLRAQLVEAAGVEKAALADGVELRQGGDREEAAAQRAPDSGKPVRRKRTDRVVQVLVDG